MIGLLLIFPAWILMGVCYFPHLLRVLRMREEPFKDVKKGPVPDRNRKPFEIVRIN
jgi:hypothetical protein